MVPVIIQQQSLGRRGGDGEDCRTCVEGGEGGLGEVQYAGSLVGFRVALKVPDAQGVV